MLVLQVKLFNGNDLEKIEDNVNKFMKDNDLLTENFLDLQFSMSGVSKKDKDGEALFCVVLIYRKEKNNGQ